MEIQNLLPLKLYLFIRKNLSKKAPIITTTHRIIHEDGNVEYFQLQIEQESAGTQHFFACIGGWLQALENGALLAVDEIEDSLHPLLTKRLIEMVQDNFLKLASEHDC